MPATIITKNSVTPGNIPTLVQGELAIQIADHKMYFGSGSVARVLSSSFATGSVVHGPYGSNSVISASFAVSSSYSSSSLQSANNLSDVASITTARTNLRLNVAVNQTTHGFVVGDLLYHNGTSYVKAIATSAAAAEVIGIVSSVVDANNFVLFVSGVVVLSGLTAGVVYFLSATVAGAYSSTEPTTTGEISKPVFVAISTTQAVWTNHRGIIQP